MVPKDVAAAVPWSCPCAASVPPGMLGMREVQDAASFCPIAGGSLTGLAVRSRDELGRRLGGGLRFVASRSIRFELIAALPQRGFPPGQVQPVEDPGSHIAAFLIHVVQQLDQRIQRGLITQVRERLRSIQLQREVAFLHQDAPQAVGICLDPQLPDSGIGLIIHLRAITRLAWAARQASQALQQDALDHLEFQVGPLCRGCSRAR